MYVPCAVYFVDEVLGEARLYSTRTYARTPHSRTHTPSPLLPSTREGEGRKHTFRGRKRAHERETKKERERERVCVCV